MPATPIWTRTTVPKNPHLGKKTSVFREEKCKTILFRSKQESPWNFEGICTLHWSVPVRFGDIPYVCQQFSFHPSLEQTGKAGSQRPVWNLGRAKSEMFAPNKRSIPKRFLSHRKANTWQIMRLQQHWIPTITNNFKSWKTYSIARHRN